MDLNAVPYLILSRPLEDLKVYLCLCLVDHLVVGVGLNRDECLRDMVAQLQQRYGGQWQGRDDLDFSVLRRN
jgi:hypothetical protein